jgi:hypothetical protein
MNLAGQSDKETLAIAIMDDFMEGSTEIDRSIHTTSFTDGWRNGHQETSETDFQALPS